jgi:hypothetical protein
MSNICTNCGGVGHIADQCPSEPQDKKNYAMWIKFDNVSQEECDEILKGVIDVKRKVAPKSRPTYAKAPKNELPMRIKEALALQEGTRDDKTK